MKIQHGLVLDKHSSDLIGYVDPNLRFCDIWFLVRIFLKKKSVSPPPSP